MEKSNVSWKDWKELTHCMEMEIREQTKLIHAQRDHIYALEEHNAIKLDVR